MTGSRPNRPYLVAELCLVILCIGLALAMRLGPAVSVDAPHAPAPHVTLPMMTDLPISRPAFPDLSHFQNYRDRPPFSITRRPQISPAPEDAPPTDDSLPPSPLQADLVGVVGPPEKRMALLRRQGAEELDRVFVGDQVEGWQIISIDSNRLTLQQGDQRQILTFPKLGGSDQP
jgi:hypothetical protein